MDIMYDISRIDRKKTYFIVDPICPFCKEIIVGEYKYSDSIRCLHCNTVYIKASDLVTQRPRAHFGGSITCPNTEDYADWDPDAGGYSSIAKKYLEEI